VVGATSGCAPITTATSGVCRDNAATHRRPIARMTPITGTRFVLPVRPGRPVLLMGCCTSFFARIGERHFNRRHTSDSTKWPRRRDLVPRVAERTGVLPIPSSGRRTCCRRRPRDCPARARPRLTPKAWENCAALINMLPGDADIWATRIRLRDDHRPRAWEGGRDTVQKCYQLPGQRSISIRLARHVARVWGITPDEIPQAGARPPISWKRSIEAKSRGCCRFLQPLCVAPCMPPIPARPQHASSSSRHRLLSGLNVPAGGTLCRRQPPGEVGCASQR